MMEPWFLVPQISRGCWIQPLEGGESSPVGARGQGLLQPWSVRCWRLAVKPDPMSLEALPCLHGEQGPE